jgi:hypothetical protein
MNASAITIHNEPCDCPPGQCREGLPQDKCINVHAAAVTEFCPTCNAHTWHEFGKCLRCGHQEEAA